MKQLKCKSCKRKVRFEDLIFCTLTGAISFGPDAFPYHQECAPRGKVEPGADRRCRQCARRDAEKYKCRKCGDYFCHHRGHGSNANVFRCVWCRPSDPEAS